MRRWLFLTLLLSAAFLPQPCRGDTIELRFLLDGKDVTHRFPDTEVVLIDEDDPDVVVTCRPKTPCRIPQGQFTIEVHSERLVSLVRPVLFTDAPTPDERATKLFLDVAPAVRMSIPAGSVPPEASVFVVDVGSGIDWLRTTPGSGVSSVMVPTRPIVILIFTKDGGFWGLVPTVTPPSDTPFVLPTLRKPQKGRGFLFVSTILADQTQSLPKQHFRAVGEAFTKPADLAIQVPSHGRAYGFWFDLPSSRVSVDLEAGNLRPERAIEGDVPDRAGLAIREVPLLTKPSIRVKVEPAARIPKGPLTLDLLDCSYSTRFEGPVDLGRCQERASEHGAVDSQFAFRSLNATIYALEWRIGDLRGKRMVDLRDGKPVSITVAVNAYEVAGAVTDFDGNPLRARIKFWNGLSDEIASCQTNENGEYSALVPEKGLYLLEAESAEVEPDGGPRFSGLTEWLQVTEDSRHEIRVPLNRIRVFVSDGDGSSPIRGATVAYSYEADGTSGSGGVVTDEKGAASLPPFSPGVVRLTAMAKGYRRSTEQVLNVTDRTGGKSLTFALRRSSGLSVRVLSPTGQPLAGARVVWSDTVSELPADGEGVVTLELRPVSGQVFFVFTRSGAVGQFRWSSESTEQIVTLAEAAPPVRAVILTPDGKPASGRAVRYALDGVTVPTPADGIAREAAGGDWLSGVDGSVLIPGLPQQGVLAIWPDRHPEQTLTRLLPVADRLVLTMPGTNP